MDDFYASEKKFPLFQTCVKVGFVKLKKKKGRKRRGGATQVRSTMPDKVFLCRHLTISPKHEPDITVQSHLHQAMKPPTT